MHRSVMACAVIALCGQALAGPYCPPTGEYFSVDTVVANATPASLDDDLREALRLRTSSPFNRISYQNGRFRYNESDLDIDTPGNLIVIYSGRSISSTWDAGATWNREHTWPVSHMSNSSSGSDEYCDFHQLRPCLSPVNSSRGNKPFGQGGGLWDPGFDSRGGYFYTFDPQDRGEMARAMFYFAVRHQNQLINCTSASQLADGQMGDRDTLLRWHFEHTADEREFFRNNVIDTSIQFNRNPFVDRNEYVWAIWGDQPNDAQITLDAGSPAPDGASAIALDMGDVIVGEPFGDHDATITKTGTTPTTYRVYTTGDAINDYTDVTQTPLRSGDGFRMSTSTDDWAGRCLAFPYGPAPHTADITGITLLAQGAPGARAGTVVIDNTDLTSAGPGLASDDADDVITLTGREVEHSNASFDDETDENTFVIDFGVVDAGLTPSEDLALWNLQAPSGFTADLRVTNISGGGDTGAFDTTAIAALTAIAGGDAGLAPVALAATTPGEYTAWYTIDVADADIPGGLPGDSLTLVLTANVEETAVLCSADFDGDGDVDLSDFGVFGAAFGSVVGDANYNPEADLDNDGDVDLSDFGLFGAQFGTTNCAT